MKIKLHLLILIFVMVISSSCGGNKKLDEDVKSSTKDQDSLQELSLTPENNEDTMPNKSNLDLLQGKWKRDDESNSQLIIEKDHWVVLDNNGNKLDDDTFIISDNCVLDYPKGDPDPDRYISLKNEEMCYYIDSITDTTLLIVYVGTNNFFSFKRVNL